MANCNLASPRVEPRASSQAVSLIAVALMEVDDSKEIKQQQHHENQAKTAAAIRWTAVGVAAAAEQQNDQNDKDDKHHNIRGSQRHAAPALRRHRKLEIRLCVPTVPFVGLER